MASLLTSDPDPGVHSAAEWALRAWGLQARLADLTKPLVATGAVPDRRWYINHAGHTMVVFRKPGEVQIGSPKDEAGRDWDDEEIHTRRIDRDFSISATETTFNQFAKFKPDFRHQKRGERAATREGPVVMLTWHRAAGYCNWLSAEEHIPSDQWCFKMDKEGYATPSDDYLTRTGYRMPTDTEWEYACRAGTTTAYSWGNDPEMFRRFAWRSKTPGVNSVLSVNCVQTSSACSTCMETRVSGRRASIAMTRATRSLALVPTWKNPHISFGMASESGEAATSLYRANTAARRISFRRRRHTAVSPRLGFRVARTLKPEGSGH